MDFIEVGNTIIAIVTALGGYKLLEFFANRRKRNAEAECTEIENEQKTIERLEQRIEVRDKKTDTLYQQLRKEQDARLAVTHQLMEERVKNAILEHKRCDIRGCAKRQPPGEY